MANNNDGRRNKGGGIFGKDSKYGFILKVTVFVLIMAALAATVSVLREHAQSNENKIAAQALSAARGVSVKLIPPEIGKYYQYGVTTREYIEVDGDTVKLKGGTVKYISRWDMPERGVTIAVTPKPVTSDNILSENTTGYVYFPVADNKVFLIDGIPYKLITDGVTNTFTEEGLNLLNNDRISLIKSRFLEERVITDLIPLVKAGETLPNNAFTTAEPNTVTSAGETLPNNAFTAAEPANTAATSN